MLKCKISDLNFLNCAIASVLHEEDRMSYFNLFRKKVTSYFNYKFIWMFNIVKMLCGWTAIAVKSFDLGKTTLIQHNGALVK